MSDQVDAHLSARVASRRDFLKSSTTTLATGALATGALAANFSGSPRLYAAGSDILKVGLIGCGGRGTGAAAQALSADPQTMLVAMGDVFADHLQKSLANLKQSGVSDRVNVGTDRQFVGFDAYKQVLESGVDVVLLTTPPHFRPAHLAAAIAAGKHVFAEKPVAVDAPGVQSVLKSSEEAQKKGLSVVSGLCWRYDFAKRETMQRVHDGAIGDIVAVQCSYNTQGLWKHPRQPEWSDIEWQLRNWLYFTWLSGDFDTEQHVHSLDKMAWAMHDVPPLQATGIGGRQVRTGTEYGHIYDHFSVVYEYANNVKGFASCRQQDGCSIDVSDHILGTKGVCHVMEHKITGAVNWKYAGPKGDMYQTEHNEMYAAIRSGKPINNGRYMATSSMLAILGRMSAYTGKTITWEQAMNSHEQLGPSKYEWGPLPVPPVATPGVTAFA